MTNMDNADKDFVVEEIDIKFDVFRPLMCHGVPSYGFGRCVVDINNRNLQWSINMFVGQFK